MTVQKITILFASTTLCLMSVPVSAAAIPPAIVAGMQVTDAQGGPVGIVTAVSGDSVTVKTDRHEARLSKRSFTPTAGKLLLGMTQAELDAEVDRGLAASRALVVGMAVTGSQGAGIGTIALLDDDFATIAISSGKKIRLSRASLRAQGQVAVVGMTADALNALAGDAARPEPQ